MSACRARHTADCSSLIRYSAIRGGDPMQFDQLKRREFISLLGGVAAWPLAARAQSSLCAHGMVSEQSISRTTVHPDNARGITTPRGRQWYTKSASNVLARA